MVAMTLEELERRREHLKKAIEAIEAGAQEVDIGELRIVKPNINYLYEELRRIENEITKLSNPYSTRVYVAFK